MSRSYQVFTESHFAYFVTATIVDWLPIFHDDAYCQIILDSLAYLRENKHTQINAFVLMPSHLHAVLWPDEITKLSDIMRDFKRFTSREISKLAFERRDRQYLDHFQQSRQNNRSSKASKFQVWQDGYHPEAIFTEAFARQKIDYIHLNPVRAKLTSTADAFQYSSARAYLLGEETYPPVDVLNSS